MTTIWDKLEDKPYQVNIGNSIKSKNVSYHSIHYNIKPPSIDHNKQGTLHCNPDDELYLIEYASQQSEEILQFSGSQKESNKELILFYDEITHTFTLEKLDSTFYVRRSQFNKSKSKLSTLNKNDAEIFDIPSKSAAKSVKQTTKTNAKRKTKNNEPEKNNPQNDFEEEFVEEFELESENSNPEDLDNKNPMAAYERMKAESEKAKAKAQAPTQENINDDDNMIKEFEEGLEEMDVAEEAEKEIEEFALENELEQELEKELEVSGGEEEEAKLTDNELEEEVLEEINDTLELDSSEEESEDNMSPNKRKLDQEQNSAKRAKPDVKGGPISLSDFAGNYEEDEESTESSSSDDD